MSTAPNAPLHVVIAGAGIAGSEALLALHALAGDRATLTVIADRDELVLPSMSVAELFALGHAERIPFALIADHAHAEIVRGQLASVEDERRAITLADGRTVAYDALLIATGARAYAALERATTWWPAGDPEVLGGLLRDLEEGYTRRVAFVAPPGAVWRLPLYELALMTAREVAGMGIDDAELTVVTPEASPLEDFGREASRAVRDELAAAGVRLETASLIRRGAGGRGCVLQPSGRRLEVERVVALPALAGPRIPGTAQSDGGFIRVDPHGQMEGSETVWAAGDVTATTVKFGGLAARQADVAAADIAARAGASGYAVRARRARSGVLLTGEAPLRFGGPGPRSAAHDKLTAEFLTPVLRELASARV